MKSVTFDCSNALLLAAFWAAALGSNVDEDSTDDRAWVEPAGWGGPNLWFRRAPKARPPRTGSTSTFGHGPVSAEVERLVALGASVIGEDGDLVVMADPEGNEFCVEP